MPSSFGEAASTASPAAAPDLGQPAALRPPLDSARGRGAAFAGERERGAAITEERDRRRERRAAHGERCHGGGRGRDRQRLLGEGEVGSGRREARVTVG